MAMPRTVSSMLVMAVVAVCSAAGRQPGAHDPWIERVITTIPEGSVPNTQAWDSWISMTPDLSQWAYAARFRSGDKARESIVMNGKRLAEHTYASRAVISPDGKHIAYIAVEEGGTYPPAFLVVDQARVQIQTYEMLLTEQWIPVFSPDSKKVAFVAERPGRKHAIGVASVESATGDVLPVEWQPDYDAVDRPRWSPDSTTLVYAAGRKRNDWVVFKGNEILGPYQDATEVVVGPDGAVAFTASDGKKHFVVLDKTPQPGFDAVSIPSFLRDGTLVYAATERKKHFAIVGTTRTELPHPAEGVAVSAGRKRLTAWYREGDVKKQRRMVINGAPGPYFKRVSRPAIDPESGNYAYSAQNDDQFFVVTPRGAGPAYAGVQWNPRVSADGTKAAFAALHGNQLWWKVVPLN
jgi:hypothetical protein